MSVSATRMTRRPAMCPAAQHWCRRRCRPGCPRRSRIQPSS
jgi:hypothetical protein